ncbi:MAG: RhuM family protein [Myxococcota bacterium]
MSESSPNESEILLYRTEDGRIRVNVRFEGETAWLTQANIAQLYQTTPQNITMHITAVYEEGELSEEATCKKYLQVREEGGRRVQRSLKHYSLPVILAVGYRVRSAIGTAFRQWATARLREIIVARADASKDNLGLSWRLSTASSPRTSSSRSSRR